MKKPILKFKETMFWFEDHRGIDHTVNFYYSDDSGFLMADVCINSDYIKTKIWPPSSGRISKTNAKAAIVSVYEESFKEVKSALNKKHY